jgi:hypothetical protein
VSLKSSVIGFLLGQLGHRPGGEAQGSAPTLPPDAEQVVRAALLPDPDQAIEALFENLLATGSSEFVILKRRGWDYIQVARTSKLKPEEQDTFRLECRVWLNESLYEHFCVWEDGCRKPEAYDDVAGVKRAMLHWFHSGRLPENVKVTNVTDEFRQLQRHTASERENSSRKIGYWIQHADFTSTDYEPVDSISAELALRKHDWATARAFMRALRRSEGWNSGEFCLPGIGFVAELIAFCTSVQAKTALR